MPAGMARRGQAGTREGYKTWRWSKIAAKDEKEWEFGLFFIDG